MNMIVRETSIGDFAVIEGGTSRILHRATTREAAERWADEQYERSAPTDGLCGEAMQREAKREP